MTSNARCNAAQGALTAQTPVLCRSSELKNHVTAAMTKTHPAAAAAALQCRSRRQWKLPPPALPRHWGRCIYRLSVPFVSGMASPPGTGLGCPSARRRRQPASTLSSKHSRGRRKAGRCPEGWLIIRVPICQSPVSFVIPRGTGEEQLVVSMPVAYKMQAACPGRCPEAVINSA